MLKLHLVDLLSLRYTTNSATNTVTNQTDGAYALVYRTYSVDRRRCNKHPEVRRRSYWYQLAACGSEIFSKSTIAHTKMGHVSKTTPLLGVICHPYGKI